MTLYLEVIQATKKLLEKLKLEYYWKNLSRDIAKYIKNCKKCLLNKVKSATKEPMKITPTPQTAFDVMIIDTIGPLPKTLSGNQYALTMICDLTKYLITVPIENKMAKTVARAIFDNFISIYGLFKELRTDQGTEYKNEVMTELCKLLKIKHKASVAYHHQTLGTVERNHRVFNEYIRSFVTDLSEWDDYLKYFTFMYNTTLHSSFDEKFTPFELVFGKKANIFEVLNGNIQPIYNVDSYSEEIRYKLQLTNARARKLLEKIKLRNKAYYDKNIRPIALQIGDKILLKKEPYNKFTSVYDGPFIINSIEDENVTFLDGKMKKQKVHKNRVIKYENNHCNT